MFQHIHTYEYIYIYICLSTTYAEKWTGPIKKKKFLMTLVKTFPNKENSKETSRATPLYQQILPKTQGVNNTILNKFFQILLMRLV